MKNNQLLKRIALVAAGFILSVPVLFSQSKITVTGTVTDVDKVPVIGAAVMQQGTTTGTSTDVDGNFTLEVPEGTLLEFSSIGFATQTIPATAKMTVVLQPDAELLDETVVVGYGVQKKESLTSAISQIRAEDITNTKTDNAVVALQGKVPGLLIQEQTGRPGAFAAELSIRGYSQPMIVVDGVVRSSRMQRKTRSYAQSNTQLEEYNDISVLQEINPEDIESISVLKDAAATIYGLGAENGVILITTKKGRVQKPTVNFSTSVALSSPNVITDNLDWVDFMKWENQMSDVSKAPHRFSDEMIKGYESGDPNYIYTDWMAACYKKFAVNRNHNVSINGGTETVNYYVGAGYTENNSILKSENSGYDRYNFNASLTIKLSDALTFKYNTTFRQSTTQGLNNPDMDWNIFYYMYASDPTIGIHPKDNPNHYSNVEEQMNPVGLLDRDFSGYSIQDVKTYNNTVDLTYDAPFLKGLKISASGAFDYNKNKSRSLQKQYDLYDYETDAWAGRFRYETEYSEMWADNTRLYGRIQALYDKSINGVHNFSAMIGAELTKTKRASVTATRKYGTSAEDSFYTHDQINNGLASTATNAGQRNETASAGYIGRLTYNYKGKYIVEAMGRYDGTYVYAPGKRWGFFPSYTLGWRVSEEPFFKNLFPQVNNLKIRWSDGMTGSVQGSAYAYLGGYSSSGSWVFTPGSTTPGFNSTTVENTILTWADVRMQDFGFDWEIWNGKFGGTFDWFKRQVIGLQGTRTVSLPDFYGVSLPSENLNTSENQGLEFALTHRNTIGQVTYRIGATATYTRSRTTYIESEKDKIYNSSMNYWKTATLNRWNGYMSAPSYHWTGERFTSLNEVANSNVLYDLDGSAGGNNTLVPGQYQLEDRDGDGYITDADVYYHWGGSQNPPLQYGLNMSLNWKGFDLSIVFAGGALKRKSVGIIGSYAGFGKLNFLNEKYTDSYHVAEYGADPWDPNTEWVGGYWPALFKILQSGSSINSTYAKNQPYNYVNAAFLRLKTIELGYRVTAPFFKRAGINNLRVYFNAGNLLTFCNKLIKDVDPEAYDQGRSGGEFPINRTFTFGFNLNF